MLDSNRSQEKAQGHVHGISKPVRLAQVEPRILCREAVRFFELNEARRAEGRHPLRCDNHRCSTECASYRAWKTWKCLAFHLFRVVKAASVCSPKYKNGLLTDNLASGSRSLKVYRGHLSSPSATPEEQALDRERFLKAISRARSRRGCFLEMHAKLHCTGVYSAHWDTLFITSLDWDDLRDVVRPAWQGRDLNAAFRYSLVPVKMEYLEEAIKYHSKAERWDEGIERVLPARKGQPGFMQSEWYTRKTKTSPGFWDGGSMDEVWKAMKAEWFPDEPVEEYRHGGRYEPEPEREPVSHRIARLIKTERFPECEAKPPEFLAHLIPVPTAHEALLRRIAVEVQRYLPTTPDKAVDPQKYADALGLHPRWVRWSFVPGAVQTPDGRYYLPTSVCSHKYNIGLLTDK